MLRWLRSAPFLGRLVPTTESAAVGAPKSGPLASPAPASPGVVPDKGLGLAAHAPAAKPGATVQGLLAQDQDGFATIKVVAQPTTLSPTRATFRLGGPQGLRLRSGEQVYLEIPPELRGRAVYQAVIEHRQVQSEKSTVPVAEEGSEKKWDQTPGVTALHFHSPRTGDAGGWRYWNAPWGSSGTDGGKYAEIRPDWECESHFDFALNGTAPVGGGKLRRAVLEVDALRLRGVGDDPTFVREVTITFAPPAPTHTDELVFTPGTTIGDLITAEGQWYGKDFDAGTYPGALALLDGGDGGEGVKRLGARPGWAIEDGRLTIPLVAGKVFTGVEIACGDTKPDGKLNTDGDIGSQGKSRLKMGLLRAGASQPEWFVDDHGVPPKGVLFGGPAQKHVAKPGDRLVLGATVDPTYVMAVRLGYTDGA